MKNAPWVTQSYWCRSPLTLWPMLNACRQVHGSTAVSLNVAGASPATVAVTITAPAAPRDRWDAVSPLAYVVLVSGDTVASPEAQVTVTPAIGRLSDPVTTTRSESGRSSPPGPVWFSPATLAFAFGVTGPAFGVPGPEESLPQPESSSEQPATNGRATD